MPDATCNDTPKDVVIIIMKRIYDHSLSCGDL
jgi:hypothetical protein